MNQKLFFLLPLAAFTLLPAAQAQRLENQTARPRVVATPPVSASELTREMSNRLKLNEGQYVKLYSLNKTRLARESEIAQQYKNDEAGRQAQLSELQAQYEQECSRILTPSQLSQLRNEQQPTTPAADSGNGLG